MTWHYEPWQRALEIAFMMVMSFAFGMIVVAVRGPRRVRMSIAQRKRLGIGGGVIFAVMIAAWMVTEEARRPIARTAPGAVSAP